MSIRTYSVLNHKRRDIGHILATVLLLLAMCATQVQAEPDVSNPPRKPGKYVFAHYMVCFSPPDGTGDTVADYKREILSAQQHGVDGLALNCGAWNAKPESAYYKTRALAIYEAAQQLGTDFKLFLSADYAAALSLEETRDIVETFRNHPNQFRHQGKPVLSTWDGGQKQADFIKNEFQGDRAIVFVPCFLPRRNVDNPGESELDQFFKDYPYIDGYLDASRYYIDWFKTGVAPAITQDRIFYFYRLHPKKLEGINKPGYKGTDRPIGWKALEDDVYVTTFLTAPAKLTIYTGGTNQSFDLPAGVHHVRLPFAPGPQRFVLQREGKILIDKTGEHEISATDAWGNFNYFAGGAQVGSR
jgi:hypothetical protein